MSLAGQGRQGVEAALAWDALEGVQASVLERHARRDREVACDLGDNDGSSLGGTENPGHLMDGQPANAGTDNLDLANVDGGTHLEAIVRGYAADLDRTTEGSGGAVKRREEAVAGDVHLGAAELAEKCPDPIDVAPDKLAPGRVSDAGYP